MGNRQCKWCGEDIPSMVTHLCLKQTLLKQVFGPLAIEGNTAALTVLENEIARRGLQEAYVTELYPQYGDIESADFKGLWSLLRMPVDHRAVAALKVLD